MTVENLEIKVKTDAGGSANELNSITSALKNIKQASESIKKVNVKAKVDATPLSDGLQDAIRNASQIDVLQAKLESLKMSMQEAFDVGNMDKAYSIRGQILQTEQQLEKATNAANKTKNAVNGVGNAAKKATSNTNKLVSSLKRIAMYRILRTIIKEIGQAFQEGLEKAYLFSTGMTGEGNRFAAAMDRIKSSGNQMKGQLGSAFISLLTAIEPVLIQLINLVTKAADAISQLLAAFTGTTYLKASATAAKFADTMKSGGAAAKEWKNQLLGFDEINRPEEPSGGSGGGGTNPLEGFAMESAPISEFWLGVADKLRPILEDIKLMFRWLSDFVTGIFMGDWSLAFQGLGEIVESFGRLVNSVLSGICIPAFDGFAGQIIKIVDGLLQYIEESWGINLTAVREAVAYGLNYVRFYIEAFAIQAGWVIQDLCEAVSKALNGDWKGAFESASKAVSDASININPTVKDMASTVATSMVNGGNASADFASALSTNLETVRGQMRATAESSLQVNSSEHGLSFFAKIANYVGTIRRIANWFTLFAGGGFPDTGSLFIANEAGPELVGTMGGRNAVANNDQIVEGIRQGVFEAVSAAMSGGSDREVNVKVYLDSREIKSGQQRLNRAMGV